MELFMKKMIVFFRTTDDIVILYNNIDINKEFYSRTMHNVTEYVSEWAKNRDLDINNLSQEDLEHLKSELILFKGINKIK
jgi:hypothetical protein